MAQSGYTPILIYASGTTTNVPLAANMTSSASGAELALNYADGKLFYKDSGGVVQVLATKSTGSIGGSNTQVQYNNNGVLGGAANMLYTPSALSLAQNLLFTDNTYDIGASGATRPRNVYLSGTVLKLNNSAGIIQTIASSGGGATINLDAYTAAGTFSSQITFLSGGVSKWAIGGGNIGAGAINDFGMYDYNNSKLVYYVIASNGNLVMNTNLQFTDNTYDIGASGATRPRNLYLAGGFNLTTSGASAVATVNVTTPGTSYSAVNVWQVGGTSYGIIGVPGYAGLLTAGSAVGDMVLRTVNKKILFTTDDGATTSMVFNTSGQLTVGSGGSPFQVLNAYSAAGNDGIGIQTGAGAATLVMRGVTENRIQGISAIPLTFYANNSEAGRFSSAGNFLLGITAGDTTGISTYPTAYLPAISLGGQAASTDNLYMRRGIVSSNPVYQFQTTITGTSTGRMQLQPYGGNVGVGVVDMPAWLWPDGSSGALLLQAGAAFSGYNAGAVVSQNWYYNAGEKFIANGYASRYSQASGAHTFSTSTASNASGAGASLTWATPLTIAATGRVTISNGEYTVIQGSVYGKTPASNGFSFGYNPSGGSGEAQLVWGTSGSTFPFIISSYDGSSTTERSRYTSAGDFLINATSVTGYGNFTNNKGTAVLSTGGSGGGRAWSGTQVTTPTASTTVDVFVPVDGAGSNYGTNVMCGHFYMYIRSAVSGDGYTAIYSVVTTGNGLTGATLTLVSSVTRGTNPVTSVQLAAVSGGSVKLQVTYNGAFTTYGACTVVFSGQMN